jgi:hypothetical protein
MKRGFFDTYTVVFQRNSASGVHFKKEKGMRGDAATGWKVFAAGVVFCALMYMGVQYYPNYAIDFGIWGFFIGSTLIVTGLWEVGSS